MLFGWPLSEVPNFTLAGDEYKQAEMMWTWLADRGIGFVRINPGQHDQRGFYLAGGMSPRGIPHAVICKDGKLWHDPHPDGGGIDITLIDVFYRHRPWVNTESTPAAPINAELLAVLRRYASECAECEGTGLQEFTGADSQIYERDCTECADIRALIAKAGG